MRVGVLTGGGDCPGLNAVIRAVVRKGTKEYGFDFVGFRDGWKGPLENVTMPLDIAAVRGILPRGGTILGSSRTNPIKVEGGIERIEQNMADLGIDAHERFLALYFEKAKKCVFREDTSNTFYPFLRVHVVGYHNCVIEHKAMRQRVRI